MQWSDIKDLIMEGDYFIKVRFGTSKLAKNFAVKIPYDVLLNFNYQSSSSSATVPLENNQLRTDYKYRNPSKITARFAITRNSFLGLKNYAAYNKQVQLALEYLTEARDTLTPIDISCKHAIYYNYSLDQLDISETKDNFGSFVANISCSEVITGREEEKDTRKDASKVTAALGLLTLTAGGLL